MILLRAIQPIFLDMLKEGVSSENNLNLIESQRWDSETQHLVHQVGELVLALLSLQSI